MDGDRLRAMQAPIKDSYREEPESARLTLTATGRLGEGLTCSVDTGRAIAEAGLHPMTGGDGSSLCSGDMLLEALVACAGVTMRTVATALGLEVSGTVSAEGDLDFRGTLGVDKQAAVGFERIRLHFELDTEAGYDDRKRLIDLTERYCVVLQTLRTPPEISVAV